VQSLAHPGGNLTGRWPPCRHAIQRRSQPGWRRSRGERGDGLTIPADPTINTHRNLIVEIAARHRLPAIYGLRSFTAEGGVMFYGVDLPDLFRKAAVYADRILRGEKPANLPVQAPKVRVGHQS